MNNLITHIQIKNFKSIRSLQISGCKRINLFIGRPNVGKSNILEALSIFSVPYLGLNKSRSLTNLIRYEAEPELFHQANLNDPAVISTNNSTAQLSYHREAGIEIFIDMPGVYRAFKIDDKSNLRSRVGDPDKSFVKRYAFNPRIEFQKGISRFLVPPFGYNLLNVIEQNESLKNEISGWFEEYGLSLVFDRASQQLKIMQKQKNNGSDIFLVPYSSIADTLQRMIFFKTAIASNTQSALIFEEPEAHSFPPYISKITQEMIFNNSNQYFIATHSPFILNDFLENSREDLAVYVVDYAKHETKVNLLTNKQLHEVFQNGVDLFTNNESFV